MHDLNRHLAQQLQNMTNDGLLRRLVPLSSLGDGYVTAGGRSFLNLSGNDYLGLGADRELIAQFYRQLTPENVLALYGPGASASRLMTGNAELYRTLEAKLAGLYGSQSSLVFNSGYHGNTGILPVLAGKGDLIVADRLCHASLIDGMRLARAETVRYRHQDCDHLEDILLQRRHRFDRVYIVTESVFSMDGDLADLRRLVALKKRYDCILYLDEAHAVGVLGPQGLGLAEREGLIAEIDLLFGTFGKALAGLGGFLICSATVADYLVNRARTLIYSTALPPVCLSWLLFVLERMPSLRVERERLQLMADALRRRLAELGLVTGGQSQIIPVIIGASAQTVQAAERLRQTGYWVTAVRPPTVPVGTARLRLSLSAALDQEKLQTLPDHIARAIG